MLLGGTCRFPQVHTTDAVDVDISQLLRMPPKQHSLLLIFTKSNFKTPSFFKIMDFLNKGLLPNNSQGAKKSAAQASPFVIVQNALYLIDANRQNWRRAAVPGQLQEKIMAEIHGGVMSGHFSRNQLYNTLCCHWWWETMYRDATSYCWNCAVCHRVWNWANLEATPPSD